MPNHNTCSSKPQQQLSRWECQDGHPGHHHRSSNRRKAEAGSRVDIPTAADIKLFQHKCMHGKASERRKYLHCDDGIMALLIQRTIVGRFWSTCYSTSIYLTGHGIREHVFMEISASQPVVLHYIQHMRASKSETLTFLVTPLCSFYFDSSFLFYTLLGKANRSKQQNNKGEAASTSSISSGAGQGNGGLFSNGEFLIILFTLFQCERSST